ncbi:UNVERIFIED_CONTAM: hypothetical protein FKN15_049992 [Acipenser sinensis]
MKDEFSRYAKWVLSNQIPIRLMQTLCATGIIQVACGNRHSLALSKDGQLFTWGQNTNGQLGLGKVEPSKPSPQPLKSLSGIPLAQIAAGGDHSFAVSLSGAVFGWGRNHEGQLGLGDTTEKLYSLVVDRIFAGEIQSFVLCSEKQNHSEVYHSVGVLCGMALYNHCVADFHFPLALFKKLLEEKPTLEDLKELCPTEGGNLQKILDEDEDCVEDLYLDFTIQEHELVPNGKDIAVTKYNRKQYVDEYLDFVFNTSVKKQFEEFKKGFSKGCPSTMWRLFLPNELMAVLYGKHIIDWTELEKNARYDGYEPTDQTIMNFWTVFYELNEEKKKHFLEPLLLRNEKILIVDCRSTCIVLVSETGQIFECNYREEPEVAHPRLLSSFSDRKIIQIACGNHHSLVLSRDGQLFTWGQNTNGQLGLGKGEPSKPSPQPLKSLSGIPLAQIAAGGDHSFAVSLSGAVHHTVAYISSTNKVYSFGCGEQGQLGTGQNINQEVPVPLTLSAADENTLTVDKIVAGGNQTFVLISQIEELEPSADIFPSSTGKRISSINDHLLDKWISESDENTLTVDKIVAGGNQTFVLISQIEELEPSADIFPSSTGKRISSINDHLLDKWISESNMIMQELEPSADMFPSSTGKRISSINDHLLDKWISELIYPPPSHTSRYLHKARKGSPANVDKLHNSLRVLQILYKVNTNAGNRIQENKFYIAEIGLCFQSVTFVDENGVDHGGLSQEFFSVITRELHTLEPGVFKLFEDSRLVWFIPKEHKNSDMFFLIGVLCGMALYNHCVADFQFPLALFKKLLKEKPTLEDLKELSPLEARSLQAVLDEDEDSVDSLDLDFTVQGHELVLNGKDILVTKYNRIQYVEAYVDFVFNKSVKKQFGDFMKGFRKGCPSMMWNTFLPVELMAVLNGNTKYEWEELEKNANYKGYEPTDENIRNFWMVFHELDEERKKHFLGPFPIAC